MTKKILICIIFIGATLRFTNLNWDAFGGFHPDEPYIAQAASRIRFFSQLNPQFFVYGGLPIYAEKILGEIVSKVTGDLTWSTNIGKLTLVGRFISAMISTLTIYLMYLIGGNYFSPNAGLLASLLFAFSPWAIRSAHFATVESWLVGFLLLFLLIGFHFLRSSDHPRTNYAILFGAITGLTLATKPISILFGTIPVSALLLSTKKIDRNFVKNVVAMGITCALVFIITSAYTILDYRLGGHQIRTTTADILGLTGAYFTLQFTHTIPYLFQLQTMIWQAGFIAVVGVLGLLLIIYRGVKKRNHKFILFGIFPLVYGSWYGLWFTKFSRYNDLMLPFITLSGSFLIAELIKRFPLLGKFIFISVTLTTMFWGLANWSIYLRPQTRISASRWIYEYVPRGNLILIEDANEPMPVVIDGQTRDIYKYEILRVWDNETDDKIASLSSQLARANFIVSATRREWAVIPKLNKYPKTGEFYQKLLTEKLGFKEVATFQSYPSLFGLTINDDTSEETVQIFDHPTVRIFKNVSK